MRPSIEDLVFRHRRAAGFSFSGVCNKRPVVVSTPAAMLAAFSTADRVTLAGSMMPFPPCCRNPAITS